MTEYVIRTEDVTLKAQHVQSDPADVNNRTRGGTATFALSLKDLDPLTVDSGETHTIPSGQIVVHDAVTVNGTLVINGTLIVYGELDNNGTIDNNGTLKIKSGGQFQTLLNYDRHAGSYSLLETLKNTQRYKERLPTNSIISSLVVGLEPSTNLQDDDIAGKWGLIRNITDARNRALTNPTIELEIDILADYTEYSDITSVQNDLGI